MCKDIATLHAGGVGLYLKPDEPGDNLGNGTDVSQSLQGAFRSPSRK